jgi:hypothetical protein
MTERLKELVGQAIGNIEHYRKIHHIDGLYSYDDGRWDAYQIVMGWIEKIEKGEL